MTNRAHLCKIFVFMMLEIALRFRTVKELINHVNQLAEFKCD